MGYVALVLGTLFFFAAVLIPTYLMFRSIGRHTESFEIAMTSIGLIRSNKAAPNQALYEGIVHGVPMVVSKVGFEYLRLFAAVREPLDFEIRIKPASRAEKMRDRGEDLDSFVEGFDVLTSDDHSMSELLEDAELRHVVARFLGTKNVIGRVTASGVEAMTHNQDDVHALELVELMLAVEDRISHHGRASEEPAVVQQEEDEDVPVLV